MDPLTSHSSTSARGRRRRARRGSFTTSPPVRRLPAIARRRSIREPRPRNPPPCPPLPRIPDETDSAAPASAISSAVNAAKSLSARVAEVAPGPQAFFRSRWLAFRLVGAGASCPIIDCEDFLDLRLGGARLFGTRPGSGVSSVVLAPEGRERPVEDHDLVLAMDEQRPACVVHLVARAEADVSERLEDVEQTPGMDFDA